MNIKYYVIILCSITAISLLFIHKDNMSIDVIAERNETQKKSVVDDTTNILLSDADNIGDSTRIEDNLATPDHRNEIISAEDELIEKKDSVVQSDQNIMNENAQYEVQLKHELEFYEEPGEDGNAWQVYSEYFNASSVEGLSLSILECHRATCRAEFSIESLESSDVLLSRLGETPLDKGGAFYLSEDQSRLVIFAKHRIQEAEGS